MADSYLPSLDNFGLDIIDINDNIDRSIVEHKVPFSNLNYLEDLGTRRRISIRCAFYDNSRPRSDGKITPTYSNHRLFLSNMRKRTYFELTHPKYGVMEGSVLRVSVLNNDVQNFAEISFEFIEQVTTNEPAPNFDIISAVSSTFTNMQDEKVAAIEKVIRDDIGEAANEILNKDIDIDVPFIDQLGKLSTTARNYVKGLDSYVASVEGLLQDVTNPANSIISTIDYATDVPGRLLKATDKVIERYVGLFDTIKNTPARFVNELILGIKEFRDVQSLTVSQRLLTIGGSSRTAYEAGVLYSEDDEKRAELDDKIDVDQFSADGQYIGAGPVDTNVMTLDAIESSLFDVRGFLLEAIEEDRTLRSFKAMAFILQRHVNDIKIDRLRIKEIEVNNMPLHLLCTSNGLSYQYAERILKLNPSIKNPNFTRGDIKIYA